MIENKISLKKLIGKGYKEFWNFKGRYLVCKGGRASKKSKTTALKIMFNLKKYPKSNALIVRQVFNTLKDSCYAELQWAAKMLKIDNEWQFMKSPLMAVNKFTDQVILFRGLDDPLGLTSLTVTQGCLNFVWIEEAYQIRSEDSFNKLDMSIRGILPDSSYFKQIIVTFNPWTEHHWLKARFFDCKNDDEKLSLTTNYLCNEFLGEDDLKIFEKMKNENAKRYSCEGLGNWGIISGLVYDKFRIEPFDIDEIIRENRNTMESFGLDFGFTQDPSAMIRIVVDPVLKNCWIVEEPIYQTRLTNGDIFRKIKNAGYENRTIISDKEEKSVIELRNLGAHNVRSCKKAPNYKISSVKQINQYNIIIHPSCVNFISEIESYAWEMDKFGKQTDKLPDGHDHLLDAMIYAFQGLDMGQKIGTGNKNIKKRLGLR